MDDHRSDVAGTRHAIRHWGEDGNHPCEEPTHHHGARMSDRHSDAVRNHPRADHSNVARSHLHAGRSDADAVRSHPRAGRSNAARSRRSAGHRRCSGVLGQRHAGAVPRCEGRSCASWAVGPSPGCCCVRKSRRLLLQVLETFTRLDPRASRPLGGVEFRAPLRLQSHHAQHTLAARDLQSLLVTREE